VSLSRLIQNEIVPTTAANPAAFDIRMSARIAKWYTLLMLGVATIVALQ